MARFVSKQEALDHPVRRLLMDRVRQDPGISLCELADGFGVTPSTVLWHARKLAAAGVLRMERCGRRRLFFASQGGVEVRQAALQRDALRREHASEALAAIGASPGITAAAVARRLGIGPHVARGLLGRLTGAGLIQPERAGRAIAYHGRATLG